MDTNTIETEGRWGNTVEIVQSYAKTILELENATSYESSKRANYIYDKYKELVRQELKLSSDEAIPNESLIPDTTFKQNLSNLIKDPNSPITKQEGRYGYFLTTFGNQSEQSSEETSGENSEKKEDVNRGEQDVENNPKDIKSSKREFLLYPLLERWLAEQNYRIAENVYNKRKNKTWGNPDIAGIKVEEHLNRFDIEISTIEVKSSKDDWGNNWRIDIFEAISHKRYANRVYFCFAANSDLIGKMMDDISEMKYYCELYRIGLLLVQIEPKLFQRFHNNNLSNFAEDDKDGVQIVEKFPAPFESVPLKYQRDFCEKTLEIKNITELFNFGKLLDA